jgi:hypothetical protein
MGGATLPACCVLHVALGIRHGCRSLDSLLHSLLLNSILLSSDQTRSKEQEQSCVDCE